MTSEDISARNRANAQKSTGPTSERGKAVVAGNARRHGATARPDPTRVATWLAVILGKPGVTPSDLLPTDERGYRALALADAEARRDAAERALRDFEAGRAEPDNIISQFQSMVVLIIDDLINRRSSKKEKRAVEGILKQLARMEVEETQRVARRHRLLKRYVREAHTRRHRAFTAWTARPEI